MPMPSLCCQVAVNVLISPQLLCSILKPEREERCAPMIATSSFCEVLVSNSFTPKLGRIGWKQGTRLDSDINRVARQFILLDTLTAAGRVRPQVRELAGAEPLVSSPQQASIPVASVASSSRRGSPSSRQVSWVQRVPIFATFNEMV
jgi:hypothetical protein